MPSSKQAHNHQYIHFFLRLGGPCWHPLLNHNSSLLQYQILIAFLCNCYRRASIPLLVDQLRQEVCEVGRTGKTHKDPHRREEFRVPRLQQEIHEEWPLEVIIICRLLATDCWPPTRWFRATPPPACHLFLSLSAAAWTSLNSEIESHSNCLPLSRAHCPSARDPYTYSQSLTRSRNRFFPFKRRVPDRSCVGI